MADLRNAGIVLAVTGLAHLVAPKPFELITRPLFPEGTGDWVQRNGVTELALGTAIAVPQTRKVGLAGLAVYASWLAKRGVDALRK
ncbi:hypothetical protein [Actinocorallia libanotica]|uniref:DoxX-like protein n=1 Tax=Actinocorallia libanotica TaxID=46162 RepID=A0ABN1RJZ5_9ACTN